MKIYLTNMKEYIYKYENIFDKYETIYLQNMKIYLKNMKQYIYKYVSEWCVMVVGTTYSKQVSQILKYI